MNSNIQFPDYNRSILSISSSIMKKYNVKSNYKSLNELDNILKNNYKNVVFLILDCLGTNILENNLNNSSILRKNFVTSVTTVFPSTTAAATTAFHSGLSPLESGWIGWMPYFKEYNRAVVLFTGNDYYTGELVTDRPGDNILKYDTIYKKICDCNKDVKYYKCFPNFSNDEKITFGKLCEEIKHCCTTNNRNLVSAYWDELDRIIHYTGINSKEVKENLKNIDSSLKKLAKELDDTIIIISADHGAINLREIYLNDIKDIDECLKIPPTIDSRFVTFFIKRGMKTKFKKAFKDNFDGKYILYTKNKFLKSGLLGTGIPHKKIFEYFGDYIVIMNSDVSIKYTVNGIRKNHLAGHSGITKEEMIVPLIVIDTNKN